MSERKPQAQRIFATRLLDRASVAARAVLHIVACHGPDIDSVPTLHAQVSDYLHDEFADVARQTLNENRPDDE
jgi:cytochrome c553